jgi:hypothetical protein
LKVQKWFWKKKSFWTNFSKKGLHWLFSSKNRYCYFPSAGGLWKTFFKCSFDNVGGRVYLFFHKHRLMLELWGCDIQSRQGAGVDVMITIFCCFWQFSAKKMASFSKTNVMIKFLHNLALIRVTNAVFFAKFFGENI